MTSSIRLLCVVLMILFTYGCSDTEREDELVDLFTTADLDLIAIEFPSEIETVVSAGSTVAFSINGTKSNGSDVISLTRKAEWSLSAGSLSRIDQYGRLSAATRAETVTITARVGVLETSIDVRVSTAEFDQVIALDDSMSDLDMCRVRTLNPVGRYVDDEDNEEIRSVDNLIIGTISWDVLNADDRNPSQRAYIDTNSTQPRLHALEVGDLLIRATAPSVYQGVDVTSSDLAQTISNNLNSMKLCLAGTSDLNNCSLTSTSVEQGQTTGVIAVGLYQDSVNSVSSENISRRVKWSSSNLTAANLILSSDYSSLRITGSQADTSTTLSAACGGIEQSLNGIDITEGMILAETVSCSGNEDCAVTAARINIDDLSVDSFEVSVNDIEVTSNSALLLDSRPDELDIEVVAIFSDNSRLNITEDSGLVYEILPITDQDEVIEEESDSPGVYNVIGVGTARVQLDYRGETFIVRVEVPF